MLYIKNLITNNKLTDGSIDQLNAIKNLYTKHKSTLDLSEKLTTKNNLVCIDGHTLPTGVTTQNYNEMSNNPGKRYPDGAKALLNFTAQLTGTTFTFPANWGHLNKPNDEGKYTVDGRRFLEDINTDKNKAIIKNLRSIVGFDGIIPVGKDSYGCIIYADVRSDYYEFYRGYCGSDVCLIPSE